MEGTHLATAEDTTAWGRALGGQLVAGSVLALCGDLGMGKTHLAQGVVAGLESGAKVTSPTFTLVHEYLDGRLPVFHFDFYRMESAAEVVNLGWDDYVDERGVMLVEWADRFPELMPEGTRCLELTAPPEGGRLLTEGA